MSKLHDFAQAVGADIKEIKTTLAGKADKGSEGVTEERLTQAITQAKTDLIGGAPEELDTLKELADKIAAAGGNVDSGIITKLTEFGNRITDIETEDLAAVYTTAKNTL
ncbi:hypothetical protein Javan535_0002 [Streptococcus phage Javan535]|uniref:hypothetical protein n=1 Tax=Streptococcus salivarius TaxID=1304 RepID=UPI000535AAF2|nr:hypothetical protein [Streptococcus salivarius]QBX20846.1 hypothetical protein Javan535_0002 [Streptococcus phage Javan535]QBX20926.1 hypothetical protein Javan539_0040 [Streptococcus phage Javan539]QBX30393.1 hypothetical protein Javan534_0002 [Streptococcus phage Javan534]AIY20831.1 hypothetical protein SSAL8618_03545 [Streptococcus salivarius]AMB82580.1 hypothetical protein AWB63_03940 [Streptococcus salivarius]